MIEYLLKNKINKKEEMKKKQLFLYLYVIGKHVIFFATISSESTWLQNMSTYLLMCYYLMHHDDYNHYE